MGSRPPVIVSPVRPTSHTPSDVALQFGECIRLGLLFLRVDKLVYPLSNVDADIAHHQLWLRSAVDEPNGHNNRIGTVRPKLPDSLLFRGY